MNLAPFICYTALHNHGGVIITIICVRTQRDCLVSTGNDITALTSYRLPAPLLRWWLHDRQTMTVVINSWSLASKYDDNTDVSFHSRCAQWRHYARGVSSVIMSSVNYDLGSTLRWSWRSGQARGQIGVWLHLSMACITINNNTGV